MRALILRTDRLGDLVLTTPLMRALSRAGYAVDVVAKRAFLEVLDENPHVSSTTTFEEICPRFPEDWLALRRWISRRNYDLTIVVPAQPKQLVFASALTGVPKRFAIWGGKWARLTLHKVVHSSILGSEIHYAEKLLVCADQLGIPRCGAKPDLVLSVSEREWGANELSLRFPQGSAIVLHPGGGGIAYRGSASTCNLPMAEYARFLERVLAETNWNVVMTGNPVERKLIEQWDRSLLENSRCWNAAGALSIRQLASIISASSLTVVCSSAPLHIANAVGAATLSPFCPGFNVSAKCWGNTNGKGAVLERSRNTCPRMAQPHTLCKDFEGELTGSLLFEKAVSLGILGSNEHSHH